MNRRSDYVFTELSHHTDDCVPVIQQYLDFLVRGDGRKAHCPFTETMLGKRQFYYDTSDFLLDEEEFSGLSRRCVNFTLDILIVIWLSESRIRMSIISCKRSLPKAKCGDRK